MTVLLASLFIAVSMLSVVGACRRAAPAPAAHGTSSALTTAVSAVAPPPAPGPAALPTRYEVGDPRLVDVWLAPDGDDRAHGRDRAHALRTLGALWRRLPERPGAAGVRARFAPGVYPFDAGFNNHFANRAGSAQAPIVLQGEGRDRSAVVIHGGLSLLAVRHFHVQRLTLRAGGAAGAFDNNVVHVERGDHVLLRDVRVEGVGSGFQEVVKVNQSQHFYLEDSEVSGAFQTVVDLVATQFGHVLRTRIHHGGDWCLYLKGGSASFHVVGNELSHCATGGFQAGEGSGFEFMVPPWIQYEAYDIKFVNNVVHDTPGSGMSVRGGYNVLLAHNTLVRVATNQQSGAPPLNVAHGARVCSDESGRACARHAAMGGWGPAAQGEGGEVIPNRNVFIVNNVVYNPAPARSRWNQLGVAGPVTPPPSVRNVPSPARADDNLVIRGNVIWNGPRDLDLGLGESSGCPPSNRTCNAAQLRRDNAINTLEPQLANVARGDYRPAPGGNLARVACAAIPPFPDARPALAGGARVPAWVPANVVDRDAAGLARPVGRSFPGAFVPRPAAVAP